MVRTPSPMFRFVYPILQDRAVISYYKRKFIRLSLHDASPSSRSRLRYEFLQLFHLCLFVHLALKPTDTIPINQYHSHRQFLIHRPTQDTVAMYKGEHDSFESFSPIHTVSVSLILLYCFCMLAFRYLDRWCKLLSFLKLLMSSKILLDHCTFIIYR